jgi:hypothetical protein
MISITADSEANVLRCPPPSESDFNLELQEVEVVLSSASTEDLEINDGLYRRNIGSSIRYDGVVTYVPQIGDVAVPKFVSANPSIATVSSNGSITTVSSGNVDIFCRAFQTTKKVNHNARFQTPVTVDTFLNYLDGSLGADSTSGVNALISSGGDLNIFSVKNTQTGTYTRNSSCWASSLDWTGVSPTNSVDPFRRGGTLVSPRHLIWANHFNIPNGATMTFVSNSNEVFTRTISNSVQIANSDIRVGVLNSDIDSSISFYSVLPANWRDYLVSVLFTFLPLITTDQEQKALCRELTNVSTNGELLAHRLAQVEPRQNFTEPLITGDSGQPMFMLVDGEMVFLGTHYTAIGISQIVKYITEINSAMTTLGGEYQLTEVDLSGFIDFSS